ncbi:MAG: hypothetical protein A3G75_06265 [Verrucomicrobia bacterium RIFCSPLOWO2_12_FULL_64_8]|nr:MAG: hypothetical protein A3G75_06265 [Verrucomicrobia bacterium RIFCSPLOWO2_12_FULL_64_8]
MGRLVRDAARLARYGGVRELRRRPVQVIGHLLFYAVTVEAEPADKSAVFIDVSGTTSVWVAAMQAHRSQMRTRDYAGLQLARARVHGSRCGVEIAIPLFPADPLVFSSLEQLGRSARHF